jgi:epoxyqueuosine reductase
VVKPIENDPATTVALLRTWATELGFQRLAVAPLELEIDHQRMDAWLERAMHGSMSYLERNGDKRRHPDRLVAGTLSVISVRVDYLTEQPASALAILDQPHTAYVARYALGRDYHKTLRSRLGQLAKRLQEYIGPFGFRAFTDSAPILERALARNAGLGWIGKHTNLIDREDGSMFFLGEIFTDLELPTDGVVSSDLCGSCTRCIDVCPTQAITAPYELDARRCISYLTIESRDPIPEHLRKSIGNRIFGCDDCQLVCPWNRYAKLTPLEDFAPRHGLENRTLIDLFGLTELEFDDLTRGSAIRRISHEQWLRNIAVALGNAPTTAAVIAALNKREKHPSALVREHVQWALSQHARAGA